MNTDNTISIISTLISGIDRCGVYIGTNDWLKIAAELNCEVTLKAPELMMKDIISFAQENMKARALNSLIIELFENRISEYEELEKEFASATFSYTLNAKSSLQLLQKV
ncbi:MAG: hypothetical protein RL154_11 [Pseudomonadota bacterium]